MGRINCLILFSFLFLGCKPSLFKIAEKDIAQTYAECNNKDLCLYSFAQSFKQDWDFLCFFPGLTPPEYIEAAIGIPFNGNAVTEDYIRIVFVKNTKIISYDDFYQLDCQIANLTYTENVKIYKSDFFSINTIPEGKYVLKKYK
jgi:hypothetical protein